MNRVNVMSSGISLFAVCALVAGCASDSDVSVKSEDSAVTADELAKILSDAGQPSGDATHCPKACTPKTCDAVKPTNELITDFSGLGPNGLFVDSDDYLLARSNWWKGFFGGPYVYPSLDPCSEAAPPTYPLSQTTDGHWNVQGSVGTWSGFGLWFGPCMVDLSAYRGVSFEIWGDVGETNQLIIDVITSENSKPSECNTNVGTCDPATTQCKSATTTIGVPTESGSVVTLLWSDFSSGRPAAGVDPTQILGFHWAFKRTEWGGVVTAPFAVDVNVGTVKLVP